MCDVDKARDATVYRTTLYHMTVYRMTVYRKGSSSKRQFIEKIVFQTRVYRTALYRTTVYPNDSLSSDQGGGWGLKKHLELDISQNLVTCAKEIYCFRILFAC